MLEQRCSDAHLGGGGTDARTLADGQSCRRDSASHWMGRKIRRALQSLTLILLVALGVRVAYACYDLSKIPRLILSEVPFLYEPGRIAYSLAIGRGFSSPLGINTGPTAWTSPVYPLVLSEIFRLFGAYTFHAFVAAVSLNVLLSVLTCLPVYFVGKRAGGVVVAAAAAWLWALFPNAFIIPSQWIWDTCLSGLLAPCLVWATFAWADSPQAGYWCAYGILWGVALMTNATLLAGLPFLLGWMAYRARRTAGGRRWYAKPILAGATIVLCCVPWTVRNYEVFHSFIPLRSALGLQLWMGNNDADKNGFPGWLHPINNLAEQRKYIAQGEVAYMSEKLRLAVTWMLGHPRREAELFKQRLIATWAGTPDPVRDFFKTHSLLLRTVFISNFLAAISAVAGVAIAFANRRIREFAVPLAAFPIVFPFAFYLSQALFRYRYPIDPLVLLLGAIAMASAGRHLGRRRPVSMVQD
jgi:4-amino-4-deoxy-L-arabinose transferase-like glycosyltransferase